jgi:glycosyltransferase involved in cell wall biosynthesis
MENYPKVGVCVPTYNGAKYIKDCIESILAQTYSNLDVLIVDDNSKDETMEILCDFAKRERRIRIVRNQKNLGLVQNWNRCVELSEGEWIKFLFQDDLLAPACIEEFINACQPDTLFAVCRRKIIFEKDAESLQSIYNTYIDKLNVDSIFQGTTSISPETFKRTCLNYLERNFIGEPTAVFLHKDVFKKYGYFNPYLIQLCDFEFWLRIAIHVGFTYVPKELATFRVHCDAASSKHREGRAYRKDFLDPIILYHEFVFNPAYDPLRNWAIQHFPKIKFKDLLIYKVREALLIAKSSRTGNGSTDSIILSEWEEISQNFPCLLKLPTNGIPRILHVIKKRWLRFLEAQI